MKMKKEDEQRIKEKVNFFYNEKCRVHVKRFDKTFWNGLITGKRSNDVYEFVEDKFGNTLLFISDIIDIDIFRGGWK